VFEIFTMLIVPQPAPNADLYKFWGMFFSPIGGPQWKISIPFNWASFFTAKLLEKNTFKWTHKFLNFEACKLMHHEDKLQDSLPYSLPFDCPNANIGCSELLVIDES
jgi:hypothetical protein